MKKTVVLLVILLSLSLVSAQDISLQKTKYFPQETLQAEITGNFIDPLGRANIAIYSGAQVHPTPAEAGLLKLQDKYLYYTVLPLQPGNYSIQIQDVKYFDAGVESSEPITKEFQIVAANQSYLSVDSGFILATGDFEIKVKALGASQTVTANFGATGEEISKQIGVGIERTFSFSVGNLSGSVESSISVGSYNIPVFLSLAEAVPENVSVNVTLDKNITIVIVDNVTEEEPEEPEITAETATPEQVKTCSDLEAEICSSGEKCDGTITFAGDAPCCKGQCVVEEERGGGGGIIIGIIILVLLAAAIWWIYRRAKKPKIAGPGEKIKGRTKAFKERMKGEEVKKSLTKV